MAHPSPRRPKAGFNALAAVAGGAGRDHGGGTGSGVSPRSWPAHTASMHFSAAVALASHAADYLDLQLQSADYLDPQLKRPPETGSAPGLGGGVQPTSSKPGAPSSPPYISPGPQRCSTAPAASDPPRCTLAVASVAGALSDDMVKLLGRWLGGEVSLQPETDHPEIDAVSALSPLSRQSHIGSPMGYPTAAPHPADAGSTSWSLNLYAPLVPTLEAAAGFVGPPPCARPRLVYTLADGQVRLVHLGMVNEGAPQFGADQQAAVGTPMYGRHRPVLPSQLAQIPAPRW